MVELAQIVDGRIAHAEVFRQLGYPEQPIAAAPEDPQVGERGPTLDGSHVFRTAVPPIRPAAACPPPCTRVAPDPGTKTFPKACG